MAVKIRYGVGAVLGVASIFVAAAGRRAVRGACLGLVLVATQGMMASTGTAGPVKCAHAAGAAAKAAVAAAEAEIAPLWAAVVGDTTGAQRVVAYRLGAVAPARQPFALPGASSGGLTSGQGTKDEMPVKAPEKPIDGNLMILALGCSIFEIGPPRAFLVRFTGYGLRFREGGADWTPPLPSGLVHALAVRRAGPRWMVSPMPGARLAVPDDAVLSRPVAPIAAPAAGVAGKR